jgi:16S rRNA (guanine966-N2)-methyltransferase
MRVITGTARGRKLQTPAGTAVRPTSDMVKEAVFSIVQFEVEGARVLDLFAGSGQMGIEALSRGARSCVFVDNAKNSLAAVRENLRSCNLTAHAKVMAGDALVFLREYRGEPFDIAFLDPPYAEGLMPAALAALSDHISQSGVVLCETDRDTPLPETAGSLILKKKYRYGKTKLVQYRVRESIEEPSIG